MLSAITLHTWAARGENFGDQIPLRVVQAALGHRIPVVREEDPRPTGSSAGGRSRPVALVITGGPDPCETPRLLAAMRRHHVIGTFLVVGAKVNAHPELARKILAQGSRLVPYTFTGADPASLPPWRRTAELSLTRHAVEAATGREASHTGAASPAVGMAMVLRDDGHTQVGQFQEQLFTSLAVHSHRLTTTPAVPEARATLLDRTSGTAIKEAQRAGAWVSRLLSWSVIAVIVLEVVQTLALVAGAVVYRRWVRARQARRNTRAPIATPVTVVVPAYNEAAGIEATVRSLASSSHPQLDIVVVDDGSTDGTADIVERLGLPGVCGIRQHNTGKPRALNTGIAHASHPLVVMTDGDTVFEPETITRVVQPFADPTVGAISGNAKVANRGGLTGRYQHMEYVAGFNLERWLFDVAECMPTVPGPIAAFRREALAGVGGAPDDTLAEETDLSMAVCRAGWRVVYAPDAVVWTEAPWQTGQLWRQRYRWAFSVDPGYVETLASVGRVRRERAVRATRPHVPAGIQGGVPAAVSRGRRRHAALPAALPPRPGDHFLLSYFGGRVAALTPMETNAMELPLKPLPLALRVNGLVKDYPRGRAVDGVDIEVRAGECVGLLGPNGAGKTTTLLMCLGAVRPDAGRVELFGRPLSPRGPALSDVGFSSGQLGPARLLTVVEYLTVYGDLYGLRDPATAAWRSLDRFGVRHLARARGDALSSGQKTLIRLVKAVMHHPRMLVLDEPTATLDPDVALRVRRILKTLSTQDGTTILITSHNMAEVEELCARVLFLSAGRVVADGTPEHVAEQFGCADLEGVFLRLAGGHPAGAPHEMPRTREEATAW